MNTSPLVVVAAASLCAFAAPADAQQKFCEQCGTRLGAGAKFCGECGAKLKAPAPRRPPVVRRPQPQPAQPAVELGAGTILVNLPASFAGRSAKAALVATEGGSKASEAAVAAGLTWLASHQSNDGRWDSDGWNGNCACKGPGTSGGDQRYDVGQTALALLAFLGNGQTHGSGKHAKAVRAGLGWLCGQQKADGSVGFDHGETIYNHALAAQALAEAFAMTGDPVLKPYAKRAIEFCLRAQNPKLGWKYGARTGRNDTSVTGWMVQALRAGASARFDVPDDAFSGARRWLLRATDSRGSVGYETPGGGSAFLPQNDGRYDPVPCMTGASVFARLCTGERPTDDGIRKGAKELLASRPLWAAGQTRRANFYYWYYGTYAMFQVGGKSWSGWNTALVRALTPNQRQDGCTAGSWDPIGEWCLAGGRIYATAINTLSLEAYYRLERRN